MGRPYRKRDKLGKYAVGDEFKIPMDGNQVKSGKKGVKPLHKVSGTNKTAVVNTGAWRLKLVANPGMTVWRWDVFLVLLDALYERSNKVFLTEREIAELAGVSRSTVHEALLFFVREDMLVRADKESWMVNPELAWKWRHKEYAKGLMAYRELRRRQGRDDELSKELPRIRKRGKLERSLIVGECVHESEDRRDEHQAGAGS